MATALNVFKTVTANVTTTTTTVYTAPTGYTTVVLLAQVSNTSDTVITVSSDHVRSGISTNLLTNGILPTNDALNLLSGKLVLNTGDSITIIGSADSSAQMLLSILETANP
jgi:hypothetical protein